MLKYIKSLNKVVNVDINSPNETGISRTTEYQKFITSKSSNNVIEQSQGDFEKNRLQQNSIYFTNDENNPLNYGLDTLDRFAMAISNKSFDGVMTFVDKPFVSTPNYFKSCRLEQAIDIVLQNMKMVDPVKSGLKNSLIQATKFYTLSTTIAKSVRLGNRVYATYHITVLDLGKLVITEWSNNGS